MSRVVSLREFPKPLPSNRRRTLSPPNEEGLKVLQCASAAFFIALVGKAVSRLAARYTWATPIKIWYVKNWVGCLVPWIMRAAQTSYFKVRLPSLMYYEFVLPWSTPAYTWMTAYLSELFTTGSPDIICIDETYQDHSG